MTVTYLPKAACTVLRVRVHSVPRGGDAADSADHDVGRRPRLASMALLAGAASVGWWMLSAVTHPAQAQAATSTSTATASTSTSTSTASSSVTFVGSRVGEVFDAPSRRHEPRLKVQTPGGRTRVSIDRRTRARVSDHQRVRGEATSRRVRIVREHVVAFRRALPEGDVRMSMPGNQPPAQATAPPTMPAPPATIPTPPTAPAQPAAPAGPPQSPPSTAPPSAQTAEPPLEPPPARLLPPGDQPGNALSGLEPPPRRLLPPEDQPGNANTPSTSTPPTTSAPASTTKSPPDPQCVVDGTPVLPKKADVPTTPTTTQTAPPGDLPPGNLPCPTPRPPVQTPAPTSPPPSGPLQTSAPPATTESPPPTQSQPPDVAPATPVAPEVPAVPIDPEIPITPPGPGVLVPMGVGAGLAGILSTLVSLEPVK